MYGESRSGGSALCGCCKAWCFPQRGKISDEELGSDPVAVTLDSGTPQCTVPSHSRQIEWGERVKHVEEMEKEKVAEMDEYRN